MKRAAELLEQVAVHGECFGYEVPCVLIAAKDDEESNPSCITNSARVWFLPTTPETVKEIDALGVTTPIEGGYFSIVFSVSLTLGCNVGCTASKDVMLTFCCRPHVYHIDGFYCFYNALDTHGICGLLSYLL